MRLETEYNAGRSTRISCASMLCVGYGSIHLMASDDVQVARLWWANNIEDTPRERRCSWLRTFLNFKGWRCAGVSGLILVTLRFTYLTTCNIQGALKVEQTNKSRSHCLLDTERFFDSTKIALHISCWLTWLASAQYTIRNIGTWNLASGPMMQIS